jgi:hypothetical protein
VQELAELRATAPIWWNPQAPGQGGFGDGGYWVVTKHRDIREVSLRSVLTWAGDPERLRSSFVNGIKHWRVDY